MNASPGSVIVLAGVVLVLVGLAVWSGAMGWFGRLPGDIRIERDSMRIYIPLASTLLISVVLTLLMYLLNRLR